MTALYTIGYTKKSLKTFVALLREAGVGCVVDIRLHNTSQLAGFSKKDDLSFLLREGFDIDYIHMTDLAPSPEILQAYKSTRDWATYEAKYTELIGERDMVGKFLRAVEEHGWQRPCLLCAEPEPDHCHRRLLAEAVHEACDGLEVIHL